jgi:RNA polymerase sigma factor (sigma-70 family)
MAATPEQIYQKTLVLRAQLGDEQAFNELFSLYGPRLLQFARKLLQSAPDRVEDLNQEIWLAIYRQLPRLNELEKFKPWAFRIARDKIYVEYRRRHWAIEPLDEIEAVPDSVTIAADLPVEELYLSLDQIPTLQREALVLHFLEAMSYEEISRIMGSSVGTVRSRIFYGKRALKQAMETRSYEPEPKNTRTH